jgi:hypothetical protein
MSSVMQRPSLQDIWGTSPATLMAAGTPQPQQQAEPDAINEGAGPIGEVIIGAAAGGVGAAARGAIEGAGAALADGELAPGSRAAQMGITELTAPETQMTEEQSNALAQKALKWGGAVGAGALTYDPGLIPGPSQ